MIKDNDVFQLFWERVELSGIDKSWFDGLGLMDRDDRWAHMADEAMQRCQDFLGQGMTPQEAIDEALGLGPSLRGDLTRAVEEGITKAAPTLSDLT